MSKRKILLGLTGTVASTLYLKIVEMYQREGYAVDIVLTERSKYFLSTRLYDPASDGFMGPSRFLPTYPKNCKVFTDKDEYQRVSYKKGDEVLHISLKDQYSAFVLICSANTLAKVAHGFCDNLVTSVARAWPSYKPFIIAPAMNTDMWNHPKTFQHISKFKNTDRRGYATRELKHYIVPPQSKVLACGEEGIGALADITDIVSVTKDALRWSNPFLGHSESVIPVNLHPGAFAYRRKQSYHSGVDLYVDKEGVNVRPFEPGVVISVEHFTGTALGTDWWNDTDCVLVKGASGVICYGEIESLVEVGEEVKSTSLIGKTKRVIKEGRDHFEITGWSPVMLHVELYALGTTKAIHGFCDKHLDPTPYLLEIEDSMAVSYEDYKP